MKSFMGLATVKPRASPKTGFFATNLFGDRLHNATQHDATQHASVQSTGAKILRGGKEEAKTQECDSRTKTKHQAFQVAEIPRDADCWARQDILRIFQRCGNVYSELVCVRGSE